MNYEAIVDFNKYTLALAAAGLVYTLEKFVPIKPPVTPILVVFLLALFLLAILLGVGVFATATSSLHGSEEGRTTRDRLISTLGVAHAATLALGTIILGSMLVNHVLTAKPQTTATCCCAPCSESIEVLNKRGQQAIVTEINPSRLPGPPAPSDCIECDE